MLKRKKQKKTQGKVLEKAVEKVLVKQDNESGENLLKKKIEKAIEGLYFISETDVEISPFVGYQGEAVTKDEILSQTKSSPDALVEEKNFEELFARLTEIKEWFGDEEKQTAQKFADLRDLLKNNLRDLKVFKIGKVQLDVYIVGLDADNNLIGVKTKAVET